MNTFYIGRAIAFAWQTLKESITPFALFALAYAIWEVVRIYVIPGISYDNESGIDLSPLSIGGSLLTVYMSTALFTIAVALALMVVRKQPVEWKNLLSARVLVLAVIATVIFYILFFVGLVLLIIPGIFVALAYGFCAYLVVDKGTGVIESFKESGRMTKGSRLRILGLSVASIAIVVATAFVAGFILGVILAPFDVKLDTGSSPIGDLIFSFIGGVGMFFYVVAFVYAYQILTGERPSDAASAPAPAAAPGIHV